MASSTISTKLGPVAKLGFDSQASYARRHALNETIERNGELKYIKAKSLYQEKAKSL